MNENKNKLKVQQDYQNGALVGSETQRPEKELVILRGITTSQIWTRKKLPDTPAYCFLKTDELEKDIPTIFRIKENGEWIKPAIPKGSQIEVRGYFYNPKNGSSRKSFTAYSYQLLPAEKERINPPISNSKPKSLEKELWPSKKN